MDTKRRSGDAGTDRTTASDSGARVLLCDDDAGAAEAARTTLEGAGYTVCTTMDERDPPDFALMDLESSRIDTTDLARRLAAAGIPFLLTAAAGDGTLIRRAIDAGAIGCFFKPLDVSALVPSITVWRVRAAELRRIVERERSMRDALHSSRHVGTAVGVLMERGGVDAVQAFESLRRRARDERISVRRLASRIVDEGSADSDDPPPGASRDKSLSA